MYVYMYIFVTGELPSFQAEADHMKEALQAHRTNLAAAQNLRYCNSSISHRAMLHIVVLTLLLMMAHQRFYRASLMDYQHSLQVGKINSYLVHSI